VLAARGARRLQGQEEHIAAPGVLQQVRRQARRVSLTAILLALVLTGVCVLMPV
jgi:hypothetical protein